MNKLQMTRQIIAVLTYNYKHASTGVTHYSDFLMRLPIGTNLNQFADLVDELVDTKQIVRLRAHEYTLRHHISVRYGEPTDLIDTCTSCGAGAPRIGKEALTLFTIG